MLEPPNIKNNLLVSALRDAHELHVRQLEFLPLGADVNTAVYRVVTEDKIVYFLKLRRGTFNEPSVTFPKYLYDQAIQQLIAPLPTKTGHLWTEVEEFKLVLYPFVEGHDAYQVALSEGHWLEFGTTLKRIHTLPVPTTLEQQLPRETYSDHWRNVVKKLLERSDAGLDPVASEMLSFLKSKRSDILHLVKRTENLALSVAAQNLALSVCHADLHAGNLFIGKDDSFYIVDWDTLLLAPKERDLMFIGAGLMGGHREPDDEKKLFYQGYGETAVSSSALAYFRYERIIQDIAAYGEELFSGDGGDEDRKQSLHYLEANFLPNGTIDLAVRAEQSGHV
jgi:spectinomycin phosphotransferase